tara:strand:- start:886 stop:3432 length:2547 start_codon:yes stop_codon:yes gene_type:complete
MAGNTLDRPLFKVGPQGDMRVAAKSGGIKSLWEYPYNIWKYGLRNVWPSHKGGDQLDFFKYGMHTPETKVNQMDTIGGGTIDTSANIKTTPIDVRKRYDINENIYGQDVDAYHYGSPNWRGEGKKPDAPIFETTPQRVETDLYGNTTTIGGNTKINWGNIYNAPFTNFGSIKKRWGMMNADQKKAIVKNFIVGTTAGTLAPDWLKGTPEWKEANAEQIDQTLEDQGLPKPALSYEEATAWGPQGDPSQLMAGMEEFAQISDEEINKKKEELKKEQEILDPVGTGMDTPVAPEVTNESEATAVAIDEQAEGVGLYDILTDYLSQDPEVSAKGIEETKAELKSLMGDNGKMMNTMMLLQLGLSMMSGETTKPGLGGFLEVASKAGKEVLPIAMQNLANQSKQDKELALAAYDIVREEQQTKKRRLTDIQDYYMKELIKKEFEVETTGGEPKGTLRTVMKKNVIETPDGQSYVSWSPIDQVFDKGERAQYYLNLQRYGNEDMGIKVGDIRIASDLDEAASASGNDPFQGDLTKSQRGEHIALASVFEAAMPDILNIQMNPKYGLHSGNFPTGITGGLGKWARTTYRETKQLANKLGVPPWLLSFNDSMDGASLAALDVQVQKGMIFSTSKANAISESGKKDIYRGEAMGPDGVMVEGDWATTAYVTSLISNPALDTVTMLQNRMGFLSARLKQPTGRLLADTIRRSIKDVVMLGLGAGDPEQVSHRLHAFTRDLYQQYVKHSLLGGTRVTASWVVTPEHYGTNRIGIKDFQDSYYNFIGGAGNSPNPPIDMSWVQLDDKLQSSAPAYSSTSGATIDATGSIPWFDLMNKWLPNSDQTFGTTTGEKSYSGAQ